MRELPFGATSDSLIASIEGAARKNKLKIAGISDYTGEEVEIEIRLARGVHTKDTVDALYAFTDCEQSISVSALVIKDNRPHIATVSDILKHNADRLVDVLTAELKIEQRQVRDRLHARTLEQIFIENRVYKAIEDVADSSAMHEAIRTGIEPFFSTIRRKVTTEDLDTLLQIPIRRISLYDITKAKREMREMRARLREIKTNLENITGFTIDFLEYLIDEYKDKYPRRTEVTSFDPGGCPRSRAAQSQVALRQEDGLSRL